MDHAQDQLFYRCYSDTSAGQLRAGGYYHGHPTLTPASLLDEFKRHRILGNQEPTALVSVTDRPLEAVHRALAKYYLDVECPGTIWIVVIRVPRGGIPQRLHHAKELAELQQLTNPNIFSHEYLFEWEIPQEYVEHRVSVKALRMRGIRKLLGFQNLPNRFSELQDTLIHTVFEADPYGTGRWIGALAQAFGPGNCIYGLAFHILGSLLAGGDIDEEQQIVRFHWPESVELLEFSDICAIDLGIRDELDAFFHI
jgi:hypothetical protein